MDIAEVLTTFNFNSADELSEWCFTFQEDWLVSRDSDEVLYTDGDDGLAVIRLSECFDVDGVAIELIECQYCDINIKTLNKVHNLLRNCV
jgi:hypothetical protein